MICCFSNAQSILFEKKKVAVSYYRQKDIIIYMQLFSESSSSTRQNSPAFLINPKWY